MQKLKAVPRAFTLGIKAEIEKIFSICPKLLINAELYGIVISPRQKKKGYQQIWEANLETLGPNVPAFINILTSMF